VIGTKTLATVTLLVGGLVTAIVLGVLAPARLLSRDWGTLFLVGCFGVVVGTVMFRFFRLGEQSRNYFRWSTEVTPWELAEGHFLGSDERRITLGENHGEAFDLPAAAQHVIAVAIALLLALSCIDSRAIELLDKARHNVLTATSSYCPEEEPEEQTTLDPNAPGCELVRRAYALGYAESLGECAPKTKERAAAAAPCTRRQRDEPLLHYAWRLLAGFGSSARKQIDRAHMDKLERDFQTRFHHARAVAAAEREMLASAPHASHHIWTNLPDPGDDAFKPESCADHYRWLPHRPPISKDDKGGSKVFEHIVAQLLFESRYEPAAGACREYHVHWSAPRDLCKRLAANPEATLRETHALEPVKTTLERYELGKELEPLTGHKQTLEPQSFLSFQCYIEGDQPAQSSLAFSFAGHSFVADEVHVATPRDSTLAIDRYEAIASLLVRGFHYGALMSEAGLEPARSSTGLEAAFTGSDYLLSRLYGLESLDIYLDAGWIAERPELLEVYPYQRHLKNYVQVFRRQYKRERGRL
jgi:hypothetical protein